METVTLVISLLALIFSGITAAFSFLAYANVVGLKNSTHQVIVGNLPSNKDPENPENPVGEELVQEFRKKMYPYEEEERDQI
jgi:hypothetical protein